MRSSFKAVMGTAFVALVAATPALAGDAIRKIEIFSRPQAAQPQEFQSVQLIAQEWRKLGLDHDLVIDVFHLLQLFGPHLLDHFQAGA